MLAEYTGDLTEKRFLFYLCSKQGLGAYKSIIKRNPTLLDILATFPSCFPPLQVLLEHLHHLQPRWYSIANSPLASPNSVKIVFNIVEYQLESKTVKGLCTPWLNSLVDTVQSRIPIPIFPKPENTFRLSNIDQPLIFIAAGTGIAPFMGYLQHLSFSKEKFTSKVLFIYGHRYNCDSKSDSLYSKTLNLYSESKLCRVIECTSQEPNPLNYHYVQDAIRGESLEIFNLIQKENATVYICGSPAMAKNINAALCDVWAKHTNLDQIKILEYFKGLNDLHRIKRDLW